jgi:hypothetical protein
MHEARGWAASTHLTPLSIAKDPGQGVVQGAKS